VNPIPPSSRNEHQECNEHHAHEHDRKEREAKSLALRIDYRVLLTAAKRPDISDEENQAMVPSRIATSS